MEMEWRRRGRCASWFRLGDGEGMGVSRDVLLVIGQNVRAMGFSVEDTQLISDIKYSGRIYGTIKCSNIKYSTIKCSTIKYSTIKSVLL